jgi:hypothetical protein
MSGSDAATASPRDVVEIASATRDLFAADAQHVYVRADGRRKPAVTEADLHALAQAYLAEVTDA